MQIPTRSQQDAANISDYQTVTICQCVDGVVAIRDDGCFRGKESIEEAAKSHGEDVWFVRFVDVTAAMLVWLEKFPTIQEVLESLRSRTPDCRRYSYIQLLAMEVAHKIVVLKTIGGTHTTGWHTDIIPLNHELARISDTGRICKDE